MGDKHVFRIEVVPAKPCKHNPSKFSTLRRLILSDLDFAPLNDYFKILKYMWSLLSSQVRGRERTQVKIAGVEVAVMCYI